MKMRTEYKEAFEKKHGVKLGFMSFFIKACTTALKEWPAVNAEIDGNSFIYKNYCDIGVVTDEEHKRTVVFSAIDNLVKGAAGQAVQNANILFGIPEEVGLEDLALYP